MEPDSSQVSGPPDVISHGTSGKNIVVLFDENTVFKRATGFGSSLQDIRLERRIYERLRDHPRILIRRGVGPRGMLFERLSRPLRSGLQEFHQRGEAPHIKWVVHWARQVIDGLWYIHSRGVLHANIGCHKLLLFQDVSTQSEKLVLSIKFCDFGGASFDGQGPTAHYETHSQQPTIRSPNIATEIFALGSTLYELETAHPPYSGLGKDEIERLYSAGAFPNVGQLMFGDIITKCWQGSYTSLGDLACDAYCAWKDVDRIDSMPIAGMSSSGSTPINGTLSSGSMPMNGTSSSGSISISSGESAS